MTERRLSELEQLVGIRSDGDAMLIAECLAEIRALRINLGILRDPLRFAQEVPRRNTVEWTDYSTGGHDGKDSE